MDAVEVLERFEKNLVECLAEEYPLYKGGEENCGETAESNDDKGNRELKESFQEKLEVYSMKSKYLEWQNKFGAKSLPLPIYWLDFTHNVLKRTMRALAKETMVSAKLEDMFSFIQRVYGDIEERLKEQQDYYSSKSEGTRDKGGPDPGDYKLLDRFKECSAVDYFLSDDQGGRRKEFIGQVMPKLRKYRRK